MNKMANIKSENATEYEWEEKTEQKQKKNEFAQS